MRLWNHPELRESMLRTFRSALEDSPKRLVLSLTGVAHLDTLGISSLVNILVDCSKHNIELRLIMPVGVAGEALRRVRIFDPWPPFANEQAALQAS